MSAETKEHKKRPTCAIPDEIISAEEHEVETKILTKEDLIKLKTLAHSSHLDDDLGVLETLDKNCEEKKTNGNPLHGRIGMVIDFVCGAESPPAPYPHTYMAMELARSMSEFQSNMADEVHAGGDNKRDRMERARMATFWIMSTFYPSSEDVSFMSLDVKVLILDIKGVRCCLLDMNFFTQGNIISGFGLDLVTPLADSGFYDSAVTEEIKEGAILRELKHEERDKILIQQLDERRKASLLDGIGGGGAATEEDEDTNAPAAPYPAHSVSSGADLVALAYGEGGGDDSDHELPPRCDGLGS